MPNIVECPIDGCTNEFDAVRAASRIDPACPECGATWRDCLDAVEPNHGEAGGIEYNHDGTLRIKEASR